KGWAGSLLRPGRMNPKLAGKRPATAWLAAGNALNLTHEGAERQRIGEGGILVIAKRRDRLDHAGQLARRPLPDEGGFVAKLGHRYLKSVEPTGPVSPRRTWHGARRRRRSARRSRCFRRR